MGEKKSKGRYESPELDVVLIKANDLITTSVYSDDDNVADDDWTT